MTISKKTLLNVSRLFLVVTTLLSCIIAILVLSKNTSVEKLDGYIVGNYLQKYSARFNHAKSYLLNDREQSIKDLRKLMKDLESIRAMDRLAPIKRKCFVLLVKLLRKKGLTEEALFWCERWVAFNERNLEALVLQGELLLEIPERNQEGEVILTKLFTKVPEAEGVTNAYCKMLLAQGKPGESFRILSRYMNLFTDITKGPWKVYWDIGNGFNEKQSKIFSLEVDDDRHFRIELDLDPRTKNLRIDPPSFSTLFITNPKLLIDDNGDAFKLQLTSIPLMFHNMSQYENRIRTSGGSDPYFYWRMPEYKRKDMVTVCIEAEISPSFSEGMMGLVHALLSQLNAIETYNLSDGEKWTLVQLKEFEKEKAEQIRKRNLEAKLGFQPKLKAVGNSAIEIYWADKKGVFTEQHKSQSFIDLKSNKDTNGFDILLTVEAEVVQLRIDLPDIPGITYSLKKLEMISGEHRDLINLAEVPFLVQNKIERKGKLIKVIGMDPYFSFTVPRSDLQLDYVHLEGDVQ